MKNQKRIFLSEKDIPTQWYNIVADMPEKPLPILNPKTKESVTVDDLAVIFNRACSEQELNQTDAFIDIPEEVRELYKYFRPTPLVRAYGLEKALDTPAHIYFKNESVSPIGSHKLNTALAQAYYCKQEGVTNVTTETGAGQWGAARLRRKGIRPRAGSLYGQIELSSEALQTLDYADLWCAGDCISQHEYPCR